MTDATMLAPQMGPGSWTANERLKGRFGSVMWASIAVASVLHFALFALLPALAIEDVSIASGAMEQVEVPLEVEVPPPPEEIARPAIPLLSTNLDMSLDVTIHSTTFADNPPSALPPPPRGDVEVSETPSLVPLQVRPDLKNEAEYRRALTRAYPPRLRDAGMGGRVVVWALLDTLGVVQRTQLHTSSGLPDLDAVALEVIEQVARFTPAINRDQKVSVWIQQPVTFQAAR